MACAAAASTGARRASRCSRTRHHYSGRYLRRDLNGLDARINHQILQRVLACYDLDHSSSIDREEARIMLRDVGSQCLDIDDYPTVDDIDFLFCLCNLKKGSNCDEVAGQEVMQLCEAWKSYLKRRDEVAGLLATFDVNEDGVIQESEFPAVLKHLNAGKDVPHDVVLWVLQQADLSGDGVLSSMELARGMCACYHWLGVDDPNGVMQLLGNHMEKSSSLSNPPRNRMMADVCSIM